MRHHLLTAVFAFVLGLSIGSLAVGQRQEGADPEKALQSTRQDLLSALAITRSNTDRPDSPISDQGSESSSSATVEGSEESVSIELGPMRESEQIRILMSRWTDLKSLVNRLETRVGDIEQQLWTLESERSGEQEKATETSAEVLPVNTPEDRRTVLVAAGVPQTTAEEIVSRQSALELERLELQDRAMREDWHRTDRYYDALRALNGDAVDLRTEVGEQAYDQYLYRTGTSNRVKVTSIVQGSEAEQSGLMPGDIVETYGDERIYSYSDLRAATTNGARGETVPVMIRRGDTLIEARMPRGPIGVRLEADTATPSG